MENIKIKYIEKRKSSTSFVDAGADKAPFIKMNILSGYDDICHGFSTRLGGVSSEHLYSLNLSFSRGDDPENVMENHRRLASAIGYDAESLVFSDQVHKDNIRICTDEDRGIGITREKTIVDTDGLLTNVKGLPLITFYADCVPLFLYDPVKKVVGLAHSGWKGTVLHIGGKAVNKMQEVYGSSPKDIIVAIGPSICQSCYEVSEDVIEEFKKEFTEEEVKSMVTARTVCHETSDGNEIITVPGKYLLDLHKACEYNFLNAGILPEHIGITDICTCCNPELLYSHRASKGMRGNLGAVIMLNDN